MKWSGPRFIQLALLVIEDRFELPLSSLLPNHRYILECKECKSVVEARRGCVHPQTGRGLFSFKFSYLDLVDRGVGKIPGHLQRAIPQVNCFVAAAYCQLGLHAQKHQFRRHVLLVRHPQGAKQPPFAGTVSIILPLAPGAVLGRLGLGLSLGLGLGPGHDEGPLRELGHEWAILGMSWELCVWAGLGSRTQECTKK